MEDIRSILSQFKTTDAKDGPKKGDLSPTLSPIPDIFFENILINYKLSRNEIIILMQLYRDTWCRPNLNQKYGIGPLQSFDELARKSNLAVDEVISVIHGLERFQLIQTIRVGQYFIRKFFTEEFDLKYGHSYDEFF